jgi:hypothetical protein
VLRARAEQDARAALMQAGQAIEALQQQGEQKRRSVQAQIRQLQALQEQANNQLRGMYRQLKSILESLSGVGLAVGPAVQATWTASGPGGLVQPPGPQPGARLAGSPAHGADGQGWRGAVRRTGPSTYQRTQGPLSALRTTTRTPRPQSGEASGRGACRRGPHRHAQHQQERLRPIRGYTHR